MSGCTGCPAGSPARVVAQADRTVALAGNANAGKSSIFTGLTGVAQVVGNWPGKTVERTEGLLRHEGGRVRIVDLPGVYSLSTFSMEELVARDFIALERPELVVNVIDGTALERNLFFTLQLLELELPMVIALNQVDLAARRGIRLDAVALGERLGLPVVRTVGTSGSGLDELAEAIATPGGAGLLPPRLCYEPAIEAALDRLASALDGVEQPYPARWAALKLLEGDGELVRFFERALPALVARAAAERTALEARYGMRIGTVISAQRYRQAEEIAAAVQERGSGTPRVADRIDRVALHPVLGYVVIAAVLGGLLAWTFTIGAGLSELLVTAFGLLGPLDPVVEGPLPVLLWSGAFTGLVAGATLVVPFVLPFYLLLAVIEDSGYLTRISVMLDRVMRPLGLHGKAIIPLVMGYGCTVPACAACRIMETGRQKLISTVLTTLVPCSAVTVVILGLVAATVGVWWALALYLFDLVLIGVVGRIGARVVPGTSTGLVMEMPDYHTPSPRVVLAQTWARTRSLFIVVVPAYVIGSALLQVAYSAGWLDLLSGLMAPVTTGWLGLPAVAGVVLLAGLVRKELTILMLAVIMGTTDMATVLTPVQLVVLALVTMVSVPCVATLAALTREFGWGRTGAIAAAEIGLALLLGGLAFRLLGPVLGAP